MDYAKIYNQIIVHAQNRKLDGYVEKHHIVPKCIGGLDIKENIVELTAREHFLCHKLLCVIYHQEYKLLYALWLMAIGKKRSKNIDPYRITSREYERIKIEFATRRKQVKVTQHHKNKIATSNSLPVYQYDLQGNFLQKWESAMDAQRHFSQKNHWRDLPDNIGAAARGSQKTSHGYIWSYEPIIVNLEEYKKFQNLKKEIICLDYEGNIIKEYESKTQALKDLKCNEHAFYKLLKGEKVKGRKGNEYNYILQWKHKK
jgi:hypothetical protein